jgi:hypothetical protein
MNIKHNPSRRTALIWGAIMIVGFFVMFLPPIIGLDGFDGGFALSILGGFIAMVAIIAMVIYLKLANILDRITKKENVLAHWEYTPEQWKVYTEREHEEDATDRRNLFFMVAVIALIVGIVMMILVRENYLVITCIILGIIAITGIAAWSSTLANYMNNKRRLGEVYIALDGVYLNRQVHVWKGIGNILEEIAFEEDDHKQPRIRIEYSSPGRDSRNFYTARVPVPPGQEELAQRIVADISAAHLLK